MNLDSAHPRSVSPLASPTVASALIHDDDLDDDLSDSGLSQFGAEIEKNLSSVSPESSTLNGRNDNGSDDAMDVDSEDGAITSHANKGRRQGNAKEYLDPDLYLLRRSVCRPLPDFIDVDYWDRTNLI
jgi:hypothetical protein